MRIVVAQLFTAQKIFAKWVLVLAFSILVISSTVFGFMWSYEQENANENSIARTELMNVLTGQETITEDMQAKLNP